MKNATFIFLLFITTNLFAGCGPNTGELKDGDIIFQSSTAGQSKAIQLATKSKYSHCGIIYKDGDNFYVYEAIQPVKMTPLKDWVARGDNGHYVIKRLKNDAILTPEILTRMRTEGKKYIGKDYDRYFEWSNDRIYCSELVWKVYKDGAGVEVGKLQELKEFDLSNSVVSSLAKERYGDNIPLNETVISPSAIFNSDLLVTVQEE